MKVLLVSDTHGRDEMLEEAIQLEKPEFLCHMGDVEGSEEYIRLIAGCPVEVVAGNNDFWRTDLESEIQFELEGFHIFMTHGHYYSVHWGTDDVKAAGYRNGADIVLFGHTHQPTLEIGEDMIVANPGSLTFPRQGNGRPSYMVMNLEKGKTPEIEIKYL